MVKVGIRELKARLSYYVQLVEAGELIAVQVRDRVVGFFSSLRPGEGGRPKKSWKTKDLRKKIERWKQEGLLLSGGLCRPHSIQPIELKGDQTAAELIRKMRDEER